MRNRRNLTVTTCKVWALYGPRIRSEVRLCLPMTRTTVPRMTRPRRSGSSYRSLQFRGQVHLCLKLYVDSDHMQHRSTRPMGWCINGIMGPRGVCALTGSL